MQTAFLFDCAKESLAAQPIAWIQNAWDKASSS
jgi:hypothetical protein